MASCREELELSE